MAVSTQTLRLEFNEAITSASPLRCNYSFCVTIRFPARGPHYPKGYVDLKIHPALKDASRALAAVMLAYGYYFEETAGGSVACRPITGGTNTSPHAHAVAFDFNPSRNGYKHVVGALDDPDTEHQEGLLQWGRYTDMPPKMIRAIRRIKTVAGIIAWQWGGYWWNIKDPMHFNPACHRYQIEAGINFDTVEGWPEYVKWAGLEAEYDIATEQEEDTMLPLKFGDGVMGSDRENKRSDVAAIVAMMERAFDLQLDNDGIYDEGIRNAILEHFTVPDGKGEIFTGNMYDDLIWALATKAAKSVVAESGGGPTVPPKIEVETVPVVKGIKFL